MNPPATSVLLSQHYGDLLGLLVEFGNNRTARQLLVHPKTLAIYHALINAEHAVECETEEPTPEILKDLECTPGTETPENYQLSFTRSTSPTLTQWELEEPRSPPPSPRDETNRAQLNTQIQQFNQLQLKVHTAAQQVQAQPQQCIVS